MEELVREIISEDIPKIRATLYKVLGTEEFVDIVRLGGMTNRSYKIVTVDSKEYLVRIPGEGTEALINRADERKSTELACSLGLDSELLYFGNDGTKIMSYITDPQIMNEEVMQQKEVGKYI